MSTTTILLIIAIIVLFGIGIRKTLKYILILISIIIGLYILEPQILGNLFGEKNVNKIERKIKGTTREIGDKIGESIKE